MPPGREGWDYRSVSESRVSLPSEGDDRTAPLPGPPPTVTVATDSAVQPTGPSRPIRIPYAVSVVGSAMSASPSTPVAHRHRAPNSPLSDNAAERVGRRSPRRLSLLPVPVDQTLSLRLPQSDAYRLSMNGTARDGGRPAWTCPVEGTASPPR